MKIWIETSKYGKPSQRVFTDPIEAIYYITGIVADEIAMDAQAETIDLMNLDAP